MSSINITPEQILEHRDLRKKAGLIGCVSGRPAPPLDFFGYRDVQIWFRDASGRMNGDPEFNRKDPYCFCFDCRGAFDSKGIVDAELVNEGHQRARETYASLLGSAAPPPVARTMTEHPEAYKMGVPREVFFPPPPPSLKRSNGGGVDPRLWVDTSVPSYGSFSEMPPSLPAPRHRDIMNESPQERLKKDLGEQRGQIQAELVRVMDKRRRGVYFDEPERSNYLNAVDEEENKLWIKLDAVELLMKE